ncbi:MAG: LLM class flavin-dependent oxidoreductase, partial [Myxococcales bacterium]|nr:LLM class flavin-dependent oxidoreductase [Myxococcales bacterium]
MRMISSPTLVHRLAELAARRPRRVAFRFLVTGEVDGPIDEVNYRELWRRVSGLGAGLRDAQLGGQRALLLFPPGLDYVTAFLACLHAGVVAVPVYPPDPTRLERTLPRLRAIAEDCDAQAVLTLTSIEALRDGVAAHAPELARLEWIAADRYGPSACDWLAAPDLSPETLALLQYTSGSTGSPRGVMVRHRNLMANGAQIHAALGLVDGDVNVSWLPPYHDMGLIGGILQTIYSGLSGVLMAPTAFLERPARWLRAISRFRGVLSGGPNFAYDLCVRKVTPAERVELDLSSWRIAFNGAEPVRWRTVQRFLEAFTPCGLRREAPLPCYGLAEVTLFASGGPTDEEPQALDVDEAALARMRVAPRAGGYPVVCCGRAAIDQDVRVVDPKTRAPVEPDGVGELWIGGPHVTGGYWGRTEETAATFAARLTTGEGPFLRTGDLGFVRDGALYITGRIKDVIIIRGRNLWPQDLERAVEESHPAVRSGGVAAFAMSDGGDERLGILAEVRARDGLEELVAAIRQAVAERHGVTPRTVALIAPGRLPKTSSGKVRRSASRALIQDEQAPLLWRDDADELEAVAQGTPAMSVLLASSDAEAAGDLYGLVLEAARRAEQLGFTAVWLPERHFHGVGGLFPNPATVAAAVAARTERIHIRAGSVIMPLHDPLRVAEEWAVVDRLSGGRVGVAFATGSSADDFVLAPDRFASRAQATCAGVEIVRQLWRGESITRRDGNGEDVAVQVFPRPLREPPLWLTCGAEEERFVEAGARGFHVLAALQFQTPEELARKIAAYRDARERAGHNPAAGHITLMLHTFVGETGAEVDALVNAPLRRYLERSVALWRRGAAELEALRPAEREAALSFALRRYRQQSSLIGTAPECAAMLERLRAAGVDELACLIDFGIPRAAALAGLERLDRVRRGDVVVTRARASSRPEPAMTARQRQLAAIIRDEATRVFGRAVPVGDQVALQALGLDSLKAVELSQRLGERLQRALTATLWFDYPTVGAAAERIARLEAGHDEATAAAFDVLTDATLPADIIARGAPVPHAGSPRRVLLTGATGFVGAYLLRELLDRTRAQVVCLVRARDEAAALARIEATLTEYGLWDPGLAARIEPLVGDLAAPGLGLDDAARDALAGDLDLIYHNGAIVNFALSYA